MLFPITSEYKDVAVESLPHFPVRPTPQMINSVKKLGILEPVIIRGKILVAGRRRLEAARLAGLKFVPARIFPEDFSNEYVLSLIENEQRKQNPVSDLQSVEGLFARGMTEQEIMMETGISFQRLKKILSLRKLSPIFRNAFEDGVIKYSVAYLVSKKSPKVQDQLLAVLEEEGCLRLKDVHKFARVERNITVSALPKSLFDSMVPEWKSEVLQKLQESRKLAEKNADVDLIDKLNKIISELE